MCPEIYDVVVIGAGHAGCEAAYVAAKMQARVLLLTMNLDTVAKMSCNPSVGGTAKGHMVREIDALGGIMGKVADRTAIQRRMLNASKGPAVWSPRCQSDRFAYALEMKRELENLPTLFIKQGTVLDILTERGRAVGVRTKEGAVFKGDALILSSGTFMRGLMHLGTSSHGGGRAGDQSCEGISKNLISLGFDLKRLKTGTPPRVHRRSIDFSNMERQDGDNDVVFSYDEREKTLPQVPCYIVYTQEQTQKIALDNLDKSPLYNGKIQGVRTRYCPSFEDKVVRFQDKKRHQLFLEPEGLSTSEIYVNGLSSSLPLDVQIKLLHSVPGMEKAEVMRPGYAIEYDYVSTGQIKPTLESHKVERLFFAGQINGTTGYEEAAAQGLMAAINAVACVRGLPPFILRRDEAYIGVMIDELTTKAITEPYRMFTSRAEYRLLLRQDNADLRLREYGHFYGLISEDQLKRLEHKKGILKQETERLSNTHTAIEGKKVSLAQLLCRPDLSYADLLHKYPRFYRDHGTDINAQIEITLKYSGYVKRQEQEARSLQLLDTVFLPSSLDYAQVTGLRREAQEYLQAMKPLTLGQASRIQGVSPADITVLKIALRKALAS